MLINQVNAHAFYSSYNDIKPHFILLPDTVKPQTDTLRKNIDTLSTDDDAGIESPVDYEAEDSIRLEAENKKAYLYGNAMVHYQDFDLKAAYIEIDNKSNLITAVGMPDSNGVIKGSPEFKQGKDQMKCEKVVYNLKTKKGKIFGISTKQNEFFIHGEAVKKDTNNIMSIRKMRCIPCEFEDARIYFRASKAKIIPNDKIVTGPLFLEVSNIPTPLGLPFGFFPNVSVNSSKAGILMPSYGYSASQGFYLQNMGYFIPVNNKLQVFLYGNIYSNGSWAINTSSPHSMFNYKVNYKYSGSFNLAFSQNVSGIPEDNPKFGSIRDVNALTKANNFRITWSHTQDNKYNPTIRFSASVNAGSSGFGKYNNQNQTNYLQSSLNSQIAFTKTFRTSMLTINARSNQNLQTNLIEIDAPQLTYAVNRMYPFKNQAHTTQTWLDKLYVDYTLQTQATVITKDSLLFTKSTLDSIKYGVYQRIPIGTNISLLKFFTLSPQATFQQYTNFQTIEQKYDTSTKTQNTFIRRGPALAFDQSYQVNLTTKVYGDYLFNSKILKQIRHQIIPTIGFVVHPDMENKYGFYKPLQTGIDTTDRKHPQPIYNGYYSRFQNGLFGGPSGAPSGALTFNINNTIDAKVRKKTDTSITYQKVAILQMLSIGGSYDFFAKLNKLSLINLSARNSFFKNMVSVSFVSIFDPYALNKYGNRSDTLLAGTSKKLKLARFTSCNFSTNATLTNAKIKSLASSKQPFSITLNYNLSFVKGGITSGGNPENPSSTTTIPNSYKQNLGATFSIKPTPNWKVDVTSGYDFALKNISYTRFTIYRDLRCWEAHITWVPFGYSKQYMLTLNLKVSSLRDIKIPKQKLWQDNL